MLLEIIATLLRLRWMALLLLLLLATAAHADPTGAPTNKFGEELPALAVTVGVSVFWCWCCGVIRFYLSRIQHRRSRSSDPPAGGQPRCCCCL